ncbi:hypothetical protein C2G38_2158828 [Gigaspora rosea]|uniref:Uncharacterized protein n=1 Tax=Gigaspora rosea TaxID=44941 RepID=A0A397W1K8_9GLOM|nr:hypothetical protein C2G38_2158828 [Gigaspora rosea]
MTSKVRDSSRHRDGCLSENCTMTIGNLFRKLASILSKSNLNNIPLTKSTSCNNEPNINGINDIPKIKSTDSNNKPNLSNQPKKCTRCGRENFHEWCIPCERDYFKSNFHKWTSGNETIDNFIRGTQYSATTKFNLQYGLMDQELNGMLKK